MIGEIFDVGSLLPSLLPSFLPPVEMEEQGNNFPDFPTVGLFRLRSFVRSFKRRDSLDQNPGGW